MVNGSFSRSRRTAEAMRPAKRSTQYAVGWSISTASTSPVSSSRTLRRSAKLAKRGSAAQAGLPMPSMKVCQNFSSMHITITQPSAVR